MARAGLCWSAFDAAIAVDEVESDVPGKPARDDPGQGVVPEVDSDGGTRDGLGLDADELDPSEGAAGQS